MGNFNLNKRVHLCCALALNLCSELTHSCVPQYISGPNFCCLWQSKSALLPLGVEAHLLPCHGTSVPCGLL